MPLPPATTQVLSTAELVEMILLELAADSRGTVWNCRAVNQMFKATIDASMKLKRKLEKWEEKCRKCREWMQKTELVTSRDDGWAFFGGAIW